MSEAGALILAGGLSRRMGRDKALVVVEGLPILTRVAGVARDALGATAPVKIMTPWPERYRDLALDAEFIEEVRTSSLGPLVAFMGGIQHFKTEWILLLACDLPYLQADVLAAWLEQLPQLDPSVQAWLPRTREYWEPLCGWYRRDSLAPLKTYIEQGGRSFQGGLAELTVAVLPPTPLGMLRNCNDPESLLGF